MVRLVKELTAAGLVIGKRLPHDRRATGLELTEKGMTFMESIQERVIELENSYTEGLTRSERVMLMELLKKMFRQGSQRGESFEFHD
ncbi:hypothetical protein FBY10_11527 [Pseudomonas sp. SJZ103]|nr:hypothetical protein FBY10_11527 [Pseudomonas sp. SJZ103]TWC80303.1 hypothetical protein FBY08_116151 [Pseudomonas sp. SJZ094]